MTRVGVALFFTTSAVMQAEKILQRQGIPVRLIPTPRTLSSDCGIAIRYDQEYLERVSVLLQEAGVKSAGIHLVEEADL
jgi:hypothetical protein